jgi:arginase
MVLAAVCGMQPKQTNDIIAGQWQRLLDGIAPDGQFLNPKNIVWIGLRDVDPGEAEKIRTTDPANAISMHEIDRFGIGAMADRAVERLESTGAKKLWVSFDADVLDPQIAPGTGTRVRGGLTYREAHLLAEIVHDALRRNGSLELAGVKIAEVNPILDRQNETANLCVEWVCSLFGKRILPLWE